MNIVPWPGAFAVPSILRRLTRRSIYFDAASVSVHKLCITVTVHVIVNYIPWARPTFWQQCTYVCADMHAMLCTGVNIGTLLPQRIIHEKDESSVLVISHGMAFLT
jgi:hypothetical protein